MSNTLVQLTQKTAVGLGAAIALLAVPSSAVAASFSWSYETGLGDIYTGIFEGTVQPDGNTVEVSKVENTKLNGNLLPATPFVFPLLLASSVPVVSFDGELMDIIACTDVSCNESFSFIQTPTDAPEFFATLDFGDVLETYSSAFFQLQPVPEPTSVLGILAVSTLAGLFVKKKER